MRKLSTLAVAFAALFALTFFARAGSLDTMATVVDLSNVPQDICVENVNGLITTRITTFSSCQL